MPAAGPTGCTCPGMKCAPGTCGTGAAGARPGGRCSPGWGLHTCAASSLDSLFIFDYLQSCVDAHSTHTSVLSKGQRTMSSRGSLQAHC